MGHNPKRESKGAREKEGGMQPEGKGEGACVDTGASEMEQMTWGWYDVGQYETNMMTILMRWGV